MQATRIIYTEKRLQGSLVFINLFLFQIMAGKFGWAVADVFRYDSLDPDNLFARLSVHHFVQMLIALAVIVAFKKFIKVDFGFQLGDHKKGMRYFRVFTVAIVLIALIYHTLMYVIGQPISYNFPLSTRNILGSLGFQLFLSGTSEEILYRALPVTMLVYIFGKNIHIQQNVTLEVVLASLLFAVAHIQWSLFPFSAPELNLFQLFYAFGMGILNGVVYQKSRSILYPMLMHSISNVFMVGTGYLFAVLL